MIAKLIVWDETRVLALERMARALAEYRIVGVTTNLRFLERLVTSRSFRTAALDTSLIGREQEWLLAPDPAPPGIFCLLAALAVVLRECNEVTNPHSPWEMRDGWRMTATYLRELTFVRDGGRHKVVVEYQRDGYSMRCGEQCSFVGGVLGAAGDLIATVDGHRVHAEVIEDNGTFHVFYDCTRYAYILFDPLALHVAESTEESSLLAPMPGRVVALRALPGEPVKKGTALLTLEAMKMEYTVKAPADGRVNEFLCAEGDQVAEGVLLLHFDRTEAGGDAVDDAMDGS
jgi:3-methylcrotonyl-CoA carboxylase alpha subunit